MLPGKSYTPDIILGLLLRRRWLLALSFLACACVAAIAAWVLPSVWQSTAVISIVPQRIPESYVRATVTLGPQDRIDSIRRDILSRPRLEQIIRDFNLYPEVRQSGVMEDAVNRMRDNVKMVEAKGGAFEVSFSAGDPVLAQRVTERLAGLFIDENILQRTQLAAGSSEFLKNQLAQALEQLVSTEQRLEAYRRAHSGELPDQVATNLSAISNTQMQLQQLRESLNRDNDRRLVLERQIADLEQPVPTVPEGSPALHAQEDPSLSTAPASVQLEQAKARLSALERRLTPEHPDVRRAKAVIAQLTIKAREESESRAGEGPTPAVSAAEILRLRRIRDLRAEMGALERNLESKAEEEHRLLGLSAEYQSRVNAAPARESELTSLLRDYDTVNQQYRTLLANSKSAEMAQELERRQGGEQFRLVEAARVPERPKSPKRPLILAGGAAAGLVVGIGFVALLELRDRSLRTRDDVTALIGLPVLAVVPEMQTGRERRRQLWNTLGMWSVTVLLAVSTAVAAWGALHR